GIASVIQVIPVIDVVDVNIVGFVPSARPVFRPRINRTEPEAHVLEPGISIHDNYRSVTNAEAVSTAKMRPEAIFGNAVAPVSPPFVPRMMFTLPMLCAMLLPNIPTRSGVFLEFTPAYLPRVFRPIGPLIVWL